MSFQTKRVRIKVYCYCNKCNGSLVDPRTKKRHISKRINYEEPRPSDEIDDIEMDYNELMIMRWSMTRLPKEIIIS